MIQVETTVTIERPPETVFARVSDPHAGRLWRWDPAPADSSEDERQRRGRPRPAERSAEVVSCEANRSLRIRRRIEDVACDAVYHFDAAGRGTCVTWTARIDATGRCRPVESLIGQAMALETEIGLAMLKHLLEGEA